jgi:hypothetical protein
MTAQILPESPIDLIIGRDTIKEYNLVDRFREQFYAPQRINRHRYTLNQTVSQQTPNPQPSSVHGRINSIPRSTETTEDYNFTFDQRLGIAQSDGEELATPTFRRQEELHSPEILSAVVPKSTFLDHIDDGSEELDLELLDAFTPWLSNDSDNTSTSKLSPKESTSALEHDLLDDIKYEGSPELQQRIRDTCRKFRTIFSKVVPPKPAKLTPFHILVDENKWNDPRNELAPRRQTQAMEAEIRKQVTQLREQGIIVDSNANRYSQIHMVKKKTDPSKPDAPPEYRMCIDYRSLNDCGELPRFPIPHIAQMHQRLGQKRAKFFGVSDFTSGYHQAPVSAATQRFTAFITSDGIYEFTRVPFGPKGAPAYFQERMALEVLRSLIYNICEVYLDDVIIYAQSEDEFITNLNTVFGRFREKGLTLKPSKCRFGMQEVEYVGRVISSSGISMSKNKIRCVLDFPQPEYMQQLKSFIGLVNYFSPFIEHHATIMQPLNDMVTKYGRHIRLVWTEAGTNAWSRVREIIENCPTLEFLNDTDPIYLETDASDYGIGGFLYQLVDGQKRATAFVSKSLTNTQLKWSTYQKEGYAIYYSLKKLATFLRDRKFILRTDHANLT